MAAFWRPPNFFTQNTGDEGKLIQDFVGWLLLRRVCVASKKKKKKKKRKTIRKTKREKKKKKKKKKKKNRNTLSKTRRDVSLLIKYLV